MATKKSYTSVRTKDAIPEESLAADNISNDGSVAIVVPPDSKYGWIIVLASFACNVIVDGIVFSSGLIQEAVSSEFHVSKAEVGLVSSLLSGFYLMAGPFVSALVNKYGFRVTTIIGAVLGAAAFGVASKVNSMFLLFLTYGVMGGIGFCFIYIPSVLVVGYYFEKWRALATGISLCGSGIGTFVFAPLTSSLVNTYGWRSTVLIQAGIILICSLLGAFYKPLAPIELKKTDIEEMENFEDKEQQNAAFKRYAYSVPASAYSTWLKHNASVYPKATDVFANAKKAKDIEMTELKASVEQHVGGKDRPTGISGRRSTLTEKNIRHTARENGPFSRSDIFFTGSLNRIPQYISQTSLGYHLSVTEVTVKDVKESGNNRIKSALGKLLQFSLLKSPSFLLLALSGFFTMAGLFVPFIYITARAEHNGDIDMQSKAGSLVPAIGIANTIARVLCGLTSSSDRVDALWLNNIFITIGGLATIFSGMSLHPAWQFSYTVLFGFSIACFSTLRSIIVVELMGLEKLTSAFGILMMFQGVAACFGGPMAGLIMDLTNSFDYSFYLSGILITLSAVLCYPLKYVKSRENQRNSV